MKRLLGLVTLALVVAGASVAQGQTSFKVGQIGGAVMLPDGRTFVVSIPVEGMLIYFDTVEDKELRRVELDFQPAALAVQGDAIFASTKGGTTVHVLDAQTGKQRSEVKFPGDPVLALACHPEKGMVYATNMTHEVIVIDPKTNTAYPTQARGQMIAVDPVDGKFVYTGIQGAIKDMLLVRRGPGGSATVSRATTGERASLLKYSAKGHELKLLKDNDNAASNGKSIAVSPDGKHIAMAGGGGWMPKTGRGRLYVIPIFDTTDMENPAGQVEVGAYPTGIAFHPKENVGVAYRDDIPGEIILFNAKSAARKSVIPIATKSLAGHVFMGFGGDGKKLICANIAGSNTKEKGEITFTQLDAEFKPPTPVEEPKAKSKSKRKAANPATKTD